MGHAWETGRVLTTTAPIIAIATAATNSRSKDIIPEPRPGTVLSDRDNLTRATLMLPHWVLSSPNPPWLQGSLSSSSLTRR